MARKYVRKPRREVQESRRRGGKAQFARMTAGLTPEQISERQRMLSLARTIRRGGKLPIQKGQKLLNELQIDLTFFDDIA